MFEYVFKKIREFNKPKEPKEEEFYYLSKDFYFFIKSKYHLESPISFENKKIVFLLSAYEWYIDRRNVKDKLNKHPFFPNSLEKKFKFRFNVYISLIFCLMMTSIIKRNLRFLILSMLDINLPLKQGIAHFMNSLIFKSYFKNFLPQSLFIILLTINFLNLCDRDFSPMRKFYYLKIKKLKECDYEKLQISEKDVINQLRSYNIKVVYQY